MGNEVDFMVHGYVPLNIFGHEVWLTTTHVCLLIVCLFMLVIGLIVNKMCIRDRPLAMPMNILCIG